MKQLMLGIVFLFSIAMVQAQTITGTVTDSYGNPFPGVSVVIANTNKGTTTDFDGKYSINATEGAVLRFSYLGMQTQNITVGSDTVIDVQLQEDTEQLNEVVVTALGIKKEKRAIGYAVQEINSEELTRNSNNEVLGGLQGKVAGVNITNTSGAAGGGSNIIIRGITSLNPSANNQPLFVVDGIPISNDAPTGSILPSTGSNAPSSSEQFSFTNRVSDINPQNVESVSILKGPAATALYGLRGANGVVVITTKRGSQNGLRFDVKSTVGFNEVGKTPESQDKYREGYFQEIVSTENLNAPTGYTYADGYTFGFWSFGPEYGPGDRNYDNFRNMFRKGFVSQNTIGINAGGENASLYGSVGYSKEEGIVPNTDYERKNIKLNGNINITDKFNIQPSITYINAGGNLANGGDKSVMSALSYWTPTIDVNDYLLPNGEEKNYTNGITDNPRYFAEKSYLNSELNRILANAKLAYEFSDWFNVSYQLGIDNYYDKRYRYVPGDVDVGSATNGFIVREGINYNEITSNLYANFTKKLGEDFNASLLLGNQISSIDIARNTKRGEGLAEGGRLNNYFAATNFFQDQTGSERKIVGLFGDLRFDYKNSIFLNITGRNDWSSTLPKANRSFFYPSVSLSYILSQTLKDAGSLPDFISYAKFRASYAEVGKDAQPYTGVYYDQPTNFPFGTVDGVSRESTGASNNLVPESTVGKEIGAELRFFDNRLGFDLAFYKQTSDNQILPVPVAQSSGFNGFVLNAGEIETNGFEALVTITPVKTKNFNWDITVNFSTVDTEVLSLPDGIDEIIFADSGFAGVISKLEKGGSIGDLYGYDWNRNENGERLIGSNGLPSLNTGERVILGNAMPDWLGSIQHTFRYKGLALSLLLERKQGGDLYDSSQRNSIRNGILAVTETRYQDIIIDGVLADGTPNNIPVLADQNYYRNSSAFNRAPELMVQDASWWRLRNITLSYELGSKITDKLPFDRVSFSATGTNLILTTDYRGYDPEGSQFSAGTNAYGFAGLNIPNTRSYLFSVNLNF